jgi:hypothetical protein
MLLDDFDLTRVAQIGLLENKDNVLQPLLVYKSEQLPGRSTPRINDRKDKQNEIGTRDKILRDRLMFATIVLVPGVSTTLKSRRNSIG